MIDVRGIQLSILLDCFSPLWIWVHPVLVWEVFDYPNPATNYALVWANWNSYSWAELGGGGGRRCEGYTICSSFLNFFTVQFLKIYF